MRRKYAPNSTAISVQTASARFWVSVNSVFRAASASVLWLTLASGGGFVCYRDPLAAGFAASGPSPAALAAWAWLFICRNMST
ncbi:hypothetical protein MSHI_03070 [Mycobacterium shinjukuense]|uniref:Uncharacterized protein n=1 Tax=Mycobacterium shinjukuense TaxID=398694 RepID=A0A7I7MJ63_9MYCO|nr:hypothetical protein MSHI_03070 [Mycobacterium shinjukuense]